MLRVLAFAASCVVATLCAWSAQAADPYPSRPIKIIVPYPPGGSADLIARMLADKMAGSIGQPVVVENKGGASGAIGSEFVARAAPDGYTLLIGIADTHAINPAVNPKLPYDPQKDFVPANSAKTAFHSGTSPDATIEIVASAVRARGQSLRSELD